MQPHSLFGILVSVAAAGWLYHTHDVSELIPALAGARAPYLAAASGFLVLAFLFRALRWRTIFNPSSRPSLWNAFTTMMVGYLFNNVMPARAGELVKVYLLGRAEAISKSMVLGTVIVDRAADLLIFAALLAVAMQAQPVPEWISRGVLTLVVTGTIAVVVLAAFQGLAHTAWRALTPAVNLLPPRFSQALHSAGHSFLAGIRGLARPEAAARFAACSVVIWLAEIGILGMTAFAFDLPLGFGQVLFVLLVITVGTMIPSSPGYLGTYEFFGLKAMELLGYTGPVALGFVVTLHAITLLGSSALGALSLAAVKGRAKIPRHSVDLLKE